jgi:chromosome segregation ATPase
MFFNNNSRIVAMNICAVSFVVLFLLSCTAAVTDGKQTFNSRVLAENSMMKKRLPLLERESDVLKKENQQNRMKIQDLETQNKNLGLELTSLNEKYAGDMAIGEGQIKYLLETIERIEKENNESMKALISHNTALEAKRLQERNTLKEQIVMQKATFDKEREQILQGNTKRELDLSNQLAALKNNLESKELEISSLKLAVSEISTKLDAATTLSETLRKARDESVAKLESVKATNKKDRDKSLVELESVKAVNANLNKNLAELSNKLASQNRPIQNSPTKTNN